MYLYWFPVSLYVWHECMLWCCVLVVSFRFFLFSFLFFFISETVNIWHRNSRHYYMMKNEIDSKFTKLFGSIWSIEWITFELNRNTIEKCIKSNRTKPIYLNLTNRIKLHAALHFCHSARASAPVLAPASPHPNTIIEHSSQIVEQYSINSKQFYTIYIYIYRYAQSGGETVGEIFFCNFLRLNIMNQKWVSITRKLEKRTIDNDAQPFVCACMCDWTSVSRTVHLNLTIPQCSNTIEF